MKPGIILFLAVIAVAIAEGNVGKKENELRSLLRRLLNKSRRHLYDGTNGLQTGQFKRRNLNHKKIIRNSNQGWNDDNQNQGWNDDNQGWNDDNQGWNSYSQNQGWNNDNQNQGWSNDNQNAGSSSNDNNYGSNNGQANGNQNQGSNNANQNTGSNGNANDFGSNNGQANGNQNQGSSNIDQGQNTGASQASGKPESSCTYKSKNTAAGQSYFNGGQSSAKLSVCYGSPSKLTAEQKRIILEKHNEFRKGENSSNMKKMIYSEKLAEKAQQLANTCVYGHAMASCSSSVSLGQNLYLATCENTLPNDFNPAEPIYLWANGEKPDYNYDTLKCNPGKKCGHYTQVAWANSAEVGCAVAYCPTATMKKTQQQKKNAIYVVCNYYEAGNQVGVKPFRQGPACSKCKYNKYESGFKCEDGLCAACDVNSDSQCQCPEPECANGQVQNTGGKCNFKCSCSKGYWGDLCDRPCNCDGVADNPAGYLGVPCMSLFYGGHCEKGPWVAGVNENCKKTCKCRKPNPLPENCK